MTKLKTPLLGLEASGTLGDTITFQKRSRTKFARGKPIMADVRSLAQVYQRWDYQDAAFLWHSLTATEKLFYRKQGAKHHMTGFAYWMRTRLTDLPDLAGRWHLDEKTGTIAYDSSKNFNHGTIYGATPAAGIIDGAQSFDGINDYIDFTNAPIFNFTTQDFTVECIVYLITKPTYRVLLSRGLWATEGWQIWFTDASDRICFLTYQSGLYQASRAPAPPLATWAHLAIRRKSSSGLIYINGVNATTIFAVHQNPVSSTLPLLLGQRPEQSSWLNNIVDHLIIYNRALDSTEILRHSLRRYP